MSAVRLLAVIACTLLVSSTCNCVERHYSLLRKDFDQQCVDWDDYGPELPEPTVSIFNGNVKKDYVLHKIGGVLAPVGLGNFEPASKTYLLVHDFMQDDDAAWIQKVKKEIDSKVNLMVVNWSGANTTKLKNFYSAAHASAKQVAKMLADRLFGELDDILRTQKDRGFARFDYANLHCVGHGFGAQICGMLGNRFTSPEWTADSQMGEITALNPVGPCFTKDQPEHLRLTRESASRVTVLHTDTALIGLEESVGHFDVYPNGGEEQRGCKKQRAHGQLSSLVIRPGVEDTENCDHEYAAQLYVSTKHYFKSAATMKAASSRASESSEYETELTRLISYLRDETTICYPVGVRCRSWDAFKVGECGNFARQSLDGVAAAYAGMQFGEKRDNSEYDEHNAQYAEMLHKLQAATRSVGPSLDGTNSDFDINTLNEIKKNERRKKKKGASAVADSLVPSDARFFLASGPNGQCLYTYRIVVAVSRSEGVSELSGPSGANRRLYLHLGLKTTEGKIFRGMQLSNVVEPQHAAYELISAQLDTKQAQGRRRLIESKFLSDQTGFDLFTGLVTFNRLPPSECERQRQSPLFSATDLCRNLRNNDFLLVNVGSHNYNDANNAKFVFLDYLSHPDSEIRAQSSLAFERGQRPIGEGKSSTYSVFIDGINLSAGPEIGLHDSKQRSEYYYARLQ